MNWYCVYCSPLKERSVETYCRERLSVETYFPRLRMFRTIRRVRRVVVRPLFPRYFFCRFDPAESYRAVRYAPDVSNLVHSGRELAVVPDALVDELRGWAGEAVDEFTIQAPLRKGDPVVILDGPMRGLSATILQARDEHERVSILLSALQWDAHVIIDRSQLRRAS